MKHISIALYKRSTGLIGALTILIILCVTRWFLDGSATSNRINLNSSSSLSINTSTNQILVYRRQTCSCTRPMLEYKSNLLIIDETSSSLCSQYSTFRGFHQRIIAISMYGPKENAMFTSNASLGFLYDLIDDMIKIYPGWILRVYHDTSIKEDIICPIECAYNNVDFCNTSALGSLGSVNQYIPSKIWRFIPAGDLLVDIMGSRDLDSPLSKRELAAVNEWLSTDKQWHVMRDHPLHTVPMLGGMWSFRPELNRTMASIFLRKLLDYQLVKQYTGRGDQTFLTDHIWPHIQDYIIAHDSFLCTTPYGKNSQPWPTRRSFTNDTGCHVGCIRPCCQSKQHPFGECPMACRPKNHTDWTMC